MPTPHQETGLIAWFTKNPVAANLLMIIILLAGVFSVFTIKKQLFPKIELDLITVQVPYLGAAPQEVESLIIDKIEESLEDVEGIEKITSNATEGIGSVIIEVDSEYTVQEVFDEIKTQVDSIASFPAQTEKPVVFRNNFKSNVLWIAIYGALDERGLKELGKQVRDELKQLDEVNHVELVGIRDYEIAIEVSELTLREYGLTFDQVVQAVRSTSIDLPGGAIKSDKGDILIRTKGQAYLGYEFENLVLDSRPDGTRLLLSDIATIHDSFEETLSFSNFDGQPSINLRVDAAGDDNTLNIADAVKAYVTDKKETLPDGITLSYWGDSSYYLKGRLDLMLNNIKYGVLLVLIILALFIRFKVAFWVMVGIPVCFLGALALMPLGIFDVSINMISLFAFILVLGIVVDDAIIIGESAYTEIEKHGLSQAAVIRGAKKVAMPATFGVLTTIAAFTPMLMVSGAMGAIWRSIALVVCFCLAFSLIESKWILPAHLARMKIKPDDENNSWLGRIRYYISRQLKVFIFDYYKPFLAKATKNRYTTLAIFISGLILCAGLISGGFIRFVIFPNVPSDFISGTVTMEEGTSVQQTIAALNQVEQALLSVDEEIFEETGHHILQHRLMFDHSQTSGEIVAELEKSENIEFDGFEIVKRWRETVPEIIGVKNLQFNGSTTSAGGDDMSFQFMSTSLPQLTAVTQALKEKMTELAGVYDIRDSLSGGNDEIVLSLKPEAEALGISLADLATQVRYGFYGAEAQRVQRDGEEIKVMIRYPKQQRHSIGDLENMQIRRANGEEVAFSSVAEFTLQPSYSTITRIDGQRSVTVSAAINKDQVEPHKIVEDLKENFLPGLLKEYPGVSYQLQGQSKEQQESMQELGQAAIFALFCIYALMAIPLKSYAQPLIIMSVIPFGVIGAFIGHLVLGISVSMLSLFGIIALAGVVVNDSLIMVDFVNRARDEGMSLQEAVLDAGTQRFRAILLTSLTTFFGLLPIVLERSLQAQFVIPMAISLAFGIVFATVITLLLIPCLYLILADLQAGIAKFKLLGKKKAQPTELVTD